MWYIYKLDCILSSGEKKPQQISKVKVVQNMFTGHNGNNLQIKNLKDNEKSPHCLEMRWMTHF